MTDAGNRNRLLAAYLATGYAVRGGGCRIVARIGEPNASIDRLLAAEGAGSGTFITAWNPGSVPCSRACNNAATERMADMLAADGRRWLAHEGRAEGWAEQGFFVLDLPAEAAVALATRFGQNAIVQVERGQPPQLLFTPLMPG